jgi:tRNA (cmo5U34)-methyltransferase
MVETERSFFDAMASRYDSSIRLGHPYYDEMLAEVARTLPERAQEILELGCGTGALSAAILARYPDATLTLVDGSNEMMDIARQRLEAAAASFVRQAFEQLAFPTAQFDLVASNMSLHHIEDKGPYYERIRTWLRPGGWLVFGDELTGAVPHVETLHWNDWEDFARQPGHWTEDDLSKAREHYLQNDHYETLARQLELLGEAGFDPVDCAWRHSNYAVFVAQA